MKYDPISRRMFLQGAGGFLLAIPVLPSLLSKQAHAAGETEMKFVQFVSMYGQAPENWKPIVPAGAPAATVVAADLRWRPLTDFPNGNINRIVNSTTFQGVPLSKLTLIQGLDLPNCMNHNFCATTTAGGAVNQEENGNAVSPYSIDSILENSTKIYPGNVPIKALRLAPYSGPFSESLWWNKVNGVIQRLPGYWDENAVLRLLFTGGTVTPAQIQAKTLVIDHVLADLTALMNGGRVSQEDKVVAQNYADQLRDAQTRINETNAATGCVQPNLQARMEQMDRVYSNHIDLLVAALACGMTKVVSIHCRHFENQFAQNFSDFHANSHDPFSAAGQETSRIFNVWIASKVGELMRKMERVVEPSNGKTLLDNSIVLWTNELSVGVSHTNFDMPVLVGGTGMGKFNTGNIYDYRQYPYKYYAGRDDFNALGRLYNELPISVMMAMGLNYADWEKDGKQGFGDYTKPYYDNKEHDKYRLSVRTPLPLFYKT